MNRSKIFYALIGAFALLIAGVYTIDSNSQEASVFSMPDFQGTTDVTEATQKPVGTLQQFNDAIVDIADQTRSTVVTVRVTQTVEAPQNPLSRFFGRPQGEPEQRERQGLGSGVIVSTDGYILTNNHVIENANEITVDLKNGESYEGTVVGRDPQTDIAVVKIDADNLQALEIGNSDKVRVGEMVLAIGSPLGDNLAHSFSMGIVSAKERSIGILRESQGYEKFIQTDAAINPGNSGGALVNMDGKLVGINSAIASRSGGNDGIGFAVPSNLAQDIMRSLIENGKVVRAYLGIYGRDIDRTLSQALGLNSTQGIVINSIASDTPAGRAGLKEGDVIKSLNGNPVGSYDSFRASIATSKPGAEVILDIIRDGESQDVEVTLGELDQESTAEVQDSNEDMEKSLGFRVEKLNADIAQRLELEPNQDGVIVTNVNQGSNAYNNGLRRFDVITSIDKQPVRNMEEFRDVMNKIAENDKSVVLLRVIKQGVSQYIAFEL